MGRVEVLGILATAFVVGPTAIAACGSDRDAFVNDAGVGDGSGVFAVDAGAGDDAGDPELPEGETHDPVDCAEAAFTKSYVGCDYWPTVTANGVASIFDFVAVVANTQPKDAEVTVTGPNGVDKKVTVPAGQVKKIYLPWVASLKGRDNRTGDALLSSVSEPNGAYHLVSSIPVIAYQFNPLEYKAEGGEGPDGGTKDWGPDCSGATPNEDLCYSWTNDASLLLPSTAMTGNYRLLGQRGWTKGGLSLGNTFVAITATQAGTEITIALAATGWVAGSQGGAPIIPETNGGGTLTFTLARAGDVVELAAGSGKDYDLSGSLVRANKPVQVITGVPCIYLPGANGFCDHIEESVLPAETLGKRYVITTPTGPKGAAVPHNVRFVGNRDGTTLTYSPERPWRCPSTLRAGEVADCEIVLESFEVKGDKEFGVASFLLGSTFYGDKKGDPSETFHAAVDQFRTKYVFLAPTDYPVRWADITATKDAVIELDGAPLTADWTSLGAGPFGIYRVDLTKSGKDGVHVLTAKKRVGVQVIGFGDYTSFQYPAGLDLKHIAQPPPPK